MGMKIYDELKCCISTISPATCDYRKFHDDGTAYCDADRFTVCEYREYETDINPEARHEKV
jgi:hypothetical protein